MTTELQNFQPEKIYIVGFTKKKTEKLGNFFFTGNY